MDLARVIFEHGGSIAGTKKVMLENHFAMLIAVYTPPTGTSPADLAQKLASPDGPASPIRVCEPVLCGVTQNQLFAFRAAGEFVLIMGYALPLRPHHLRL